MTTNKDPRIHNIDRTALATVRTDVGEKTYWQDAEGHVRETRYEYAKGFLGGDKSSIIAAADDILHRGPLAAVSSKETSKAVSLFYVNDKSCLRALLYSSTTQSWSPLLSLNNLNLPAHTDSRIAVSQFGPHDSQIRLFYQDRWAILRELAFDGSSWKHVSDFELPALTGSSLAAEKWLNDDGTLREIQFFYQDPTREVRSHFYLADKDKWYWGYLHLPNLPPGCGIASAAHRHLGYNADVCRVFIVEPSPQDPETSRITEHAFYSDTEEWKVESLGPVLMERSKLAATWFPIGENPDIRLFFQGRDGRLRGFNFQNRKWFNEHDVPCGA